MNSNKFVSNKQLHSSANDPFAAAFGPTPSAASKPARGPDPFGSDPFAPAAAAGAKAAPTTQDDWFVSSQSPFKARTPPKVDGVRMGSKAHKQVSDINGSICDRNLINSNYNF